MKLSQGGGGGQFFFFLNNNLLVVLVFGVLTKAMMVRWQMVIIVGLCVLHVLVVVERECRLFTKEPYNIGNNDIPNKIHLNELFEEIKSV